MAYTGKAKRLIDKNNVKVGDFISLHWKGDTLTGWLMPRLETGEQDSLIIKLENGYNVGLKDVDKIKKIGPRIEIGKIPSIAIKKQPGLPSIALISTGGTIGTHVDYKTGGVFMCRTPEEIVATTPGLMEFVNLRSISSLFTIASEDMNYTHWQKLAKAVAKELNGGAEGVIITHGTDTLHYTAAALSFMLKDLCKPVALVGAQRSPDRASFDGSMNLICGAHYAASDIAEVATVMHATANDDYCHAIRGTKVRKMHTSRRDAFKSINEKPLARVYPDGRIEKLNEVMKKRGENIVRAETDFEPKVAIVKVYPGADPSIIDFYIQKKFKGIVIEATGLGHVPTGKSGARSGRLAKKLSWIPAIERAVKKGVVVAVTSQTVYGRVNAFVYRNLRLLRDAGAVHCSDMHTETAYVKLGWLLGQKLERHEVKRMMLENIAGE
ncbi:MAG: Glu-tRNA(Gln) amidotransferase subunit GatD, partial [Candidatus Micrarchaeota archaeon]